MTGLAIASAAAMVDSPVPRGTENLRVDHWDIGGTRLWGGSWLTIIAAHAAIVVGALWWKQHSPALPPPPSAMMIELAPLPAAPPAPPTIRPPDKVQDAARPVERKVEDLPKPPPVVKKAAVALPKPKPLPPPVKPMPEAPMAETPVKDTTAPVAQPVAPAAANAAPAPGPSTPFNSNAKANWQGLMSAHLERAKRYPRTAQLRRQQGVSTVHFRMDRQGKVLSVELIRGAGHDILDEESMALIKRAEPLPPPPPEMVGEILDLTVPIQFFLR